MLPEALPAFAEVAYPILSKFFTPNSCISIARVTVECLRTFGIEAEAVAVTWGVEMINRKLAYVAGVPEDQKAELNKQAKSWVDRGTDDGSPGFWGHVVVIAERKVLIDPTFCQVFHAFVAEGHECPTGEFILMLGDGQDLPPDFQLKIKLVTDDDEISAHYIALADTSFKDAPAWEFDAAMKIVASEIIYAIEKRLEA